MDYLRQAGTKAEVNDGGKIRRLPFLGQGVPPQPGTKVAASRNGCCCPSGVPLVPGVSEEILRRDPRRVASVVNPPQSIPNKFVSMGLQSMTSAASYGPGFFEKTKFNDLIGQDYTFNLYGNLRLTPPVPNTFVTWRAKTNTYSLSKLKLPQKTLTFYFWAERSFIGGGMDGVNGNYYARNGGSFIGANRAVLTLLKNTEQYNDNTLATPYGNPANLNVTYYIFDPYFVDPIWYNHRWYDLVFDLYSQYKPQDYYAREIAEFKETHPRGKLYYHREMLGSHEMFKEWYKDPTKYTYERLY